MQLSIVRTAATMSALAALSACSDTSNWLTAVSSRPAQLCPLRDDALAFAPTAAPIDLPPRAGVPSKPLYYRVPIYYATNRAEVCTLGKLEDFGGNRGRLTFGQVDAFIKQVPGEFIASQFKPRWVGPDDLQFRQRPVASSQREWLAHVEAGSRVMLFVHGYNNSFQMAAERAARIALGTGFDGKVVLFSWPSRAETLAYVADGESSLWGVGDFKTTLDQILTADGVSEVVIVAHSMGSRVVSAILADRARAGANGSKIKQVVLAAPDIDAQVFNRDIAPALTAHPLTIYVSAKDRAVGGSRGVHYYPRLGQGYLPHPAAPIEVIDVTALHRGLGHSYIAEDGAVLTDLKCVIIEHRKAGQRAHLEQIDHSGVRYWRLQKGRLTYGSPCAP